jgi:5-hydroxyisourate hydrolase-like protein (transthyretin family)
VTTFASASRLTASIPAGDLSVIGTALVTVFNPSTGTSTARPFSIQTAPVLNVSSTNITTGTALTVTLTGGFGGGTDWLAFAPTSAPNNSYVQYTYVGAGVTTRTWTVTVTAPGTFEFRLFTAGPSRLATSAPITVTAGTPPALAVSTTSAAPGSPVTVTLTNGYGGDTDWLALAQTNTPSNSYVQYAYVGANMTTRTWTVTMPTMPGTYEFRLFLNNGYTLAATSSTVTVTVGTPPILTVSTTSAAPGTPVTVTLTNGYGGATDWLAIAQTGTPNTGYVQYTYVGANVTPGTYEFRLFLNNGYTLAAKSPPITVN